MATRYESKVKKLGDDILSWIGDFLYNEDFPSCQVTKKGLLVLLDSIRDYAEEGEKLYPEIIMTTSLSLLVQTLPSYRVITVGKCRLSEDAFIKLLKRCAPLAVDGWVIYVEISDAKITYGLVSAESSELSASIYQHLVGELSVSESTAHIAYIRPIGTEFLEIRGSKTELIICLKFKGQYEPSGDRIKPLIGHIISDADKKYSEVLKAFFQRLFEKALNESHGCIIAVIWNKEDNVANLQEKCDAAFFEEPINLVEPVVQSEETKTRESSTIMRSYSSIVQRMINHDGITIFSTDGKLLAYNLFLHNIEVGHNVIGGSRKRAYKALVESGLFKCCLFRSHDGNMEIWEKQNE